MFKNESEKQYVIDALIDWIAPLQSPRETLTAPFIGTTFPENLMVGHPREMIIDAVRLCLIDAWSHTPPWLVQLINILPVGVLDSKLAEICNQLHHPPPPSPSPLDSTILGNDMPFVNRAPLRKHLRRLATPAANPRPILIVNGSSKSGKSYSTRYIEHFSYNQPPIVTYPYEFDTELGLEIGAEQVARDLVSMMGRPLNAMPPPTTNQKLYARQLALWVLNEAAQAPSQHWFILDNFRGEKLRPDTRDLLIALSDRITTGVFPQRCRLILIGFERALLTVDPGKVEEESIKPCSPRDIDESVGEILRHAPAPVAAGRISQLILSNLPNGDSRMGELNMRLRALLHAVQKVREILASLPGANYEEVLVKMLEDLPSGQGRLQELRSRLEELRESV